MFFIKSYIDCVMLQMLASVLAATPTSIGLACGNDVAKPDLARSLTWQVKKSLHAVQYYRLVSQFIFHYVYHNLWLMESIHPRNILLARGYRQAEWPHFMQPADTT